MINLGFFLRFFVNRAPGLRTPVKTSTIHVDISTKFILSLPSIIHLNLELHISLPCFIPLLHDLLLSFNQVLTDVFQLNLN